VVCINKVNDYERNILSKLKGEINMITKFDESIMKLLRIERGLEESDTLQDDKINSYSVNEAYRNLLKFGHYDKFNVEINPEYLKQFR
jgi:hypothetical protein